MARQRIDYLKVDRLDVQETFVAGGTNVPLANIGASSSGPPVIYQTDPNLSTRRILTSSYETLTSTVVTGLEANYLYRLTLHLEFSGYTGGGLGGVDNNFKIRARTAAGGNPANNNTDNLWLAVSGGATVFAGSYNTYYFPATYQVLQSTGWSILDLASNGNGTRLHLGILYLTGSTADSRSVKFEMGKNDPDPGGYFDVYDMETTILLEPIRSMV